MELSTLKAQASLTYLNAKLERGHEKALQELAKVFDLHPEGKSFQSIKPAWTQRHSEETKIVYLKLIEEGCSSTEAMQKIYDSNKTQFSSLGTVSARLKETGLKKLVP